MSSRRQQARRPRQPDSEESREIPWMVVVALVGALILAFTWSFMAAAYAKEVEGWHSTGDSVSVDIRRTAIRSFVGLIGNGFSQIPNAPAVIKFNFANKIWLPIGGFALFLVAVGIGVALNRLDQELSSEPTWKKPREFATPKGDGSNTSRKPKKKRRPLPPPGHPGSKRRRP
ncbi:hypothetical protein [Thalassoroseus pseudoceratinae]|uniref:hypothetical protein n=1 Tax=Thalassoroseus pseudoceratinae TaxID=2713176 RepID=UPI0014247A55|nr:hypothetical protein [Thalassoroseus pseudoceratinae]